MCEKYTKDGKTAILVSRGYGAGWSTWEGRELAYDKRVVEKYLAGISENEMKEYLNSIGYEDVYMGGYSQIQVVWLTVGTMFRIKEYDGCESLELADDIDWIVA